MIEKPPADNQPPQRKRFVCCDPAVMGRYCDTPMVLPGGVFCVHAPSELWDVARGEAAE